MATFTVFLPFTSQTILLQIFYGLYSEHKSNKKYTLTNNNALPELIQGGVQPHKSIHCINPTNYQSTTTHFHHETRHTTTMLSLLNLYLSYITHGTKGKQQNRVISSSLTSPTPTLSDTTSPYEIIRGHSARKNSVKVQMPFTFLFPSFPCHKTT